MPQHIRQVHPELLKYQCLACDKNFKESVGFFVHLQKTQACLAVYEQKMGRKLDESQFIIHFEQPTDSTGDGIQSKNMMFQNEYISKHLHNMY